MHDAVADVLRERAALDRGALPAVMASIVLHAALTGAGVWAAMRHPAPKPATMVNIQFASMPRSAPAVARSARPAEPAVEQPKPRLQEPAPKLREPAPAPQKAAARPEKGTVPFSPFGRSTKKGSEAPPAPEPAPAAAGGVGTADIPVGGTGVTGLEGGDFPYTLYIQGMQRRIGSNWFRPRQTSAGAAAIVYFRVLRNGSITDARIETPSGNGAFDRAALSAVLSSSPLTPLPFGYAGTYLGVHLTFK